MYTVAAGIAGARHKVKRAGQLLLFIVAIIAGATSYILWMLMR